MKKLVILLVSLFTLVSLQAQKQKVRLPLWTTHSKNTDIIGLSWGLGSFNHDKEKNLIRTYGIRLETNPLSFFHFMAPRTPLSSSEEAYQSKLTTHVAQKIYGLNIAGGSFEPKDAYGISVTAFIHYSRKNNGIMVAGLTNHVERANGIAIGLGGNGIYQGNGLMVSSAWGNYSVRFNGIQISMENHILEKGRGIQIGLWNKATNFRGLQFGFWNKNDKRSLPLINWQFKS
jgi:hypothetical protein